jgi:hypothetical protein
MGGVCGVGAGLVWLDDHVGYCLGMTKALLMTGVWTSRLGVLCLDVSRKMMGRTTLEDEWTLSRLHVLQLAGRTPFIGSDYLAMIHGYA